MDDLINKRLNLEIKEFIIKNIKDIFNNAKLQPGVKNAFDYFNEKGYQIVIITARGSGLNYNYKKVTKDYLKKYELNYNKIFFGYEEKGLKAFEEKIDMFIDDKIKVLDSVSSHGIKAIHFTEEKGSTEQYIAFNDWNEIIKYIDNQK